MKPKTEWNTLGAIIHSCEWGRLRHEDWCEKECVRINQRGQKHKVEYQVRREKKECRVVCYQLAKGGNDVQRPRNDSSS